MLVISRKVGESLIISDNIKVSILSVSNEKITIGIDAPKEIKIVRSELLETIEANQVSAERIQASHYEGLANLLKNQNND
ncbi:MAG: carbon storage regulator CsrA [Eubacteriales bacterium]|nr:carbon storage regulator CsrA [Eubacteriales bacterium]